MYLKTVLARFYRSFNYDYLRKYDPKVQQRDPWETIREGLWYPYVQIPIERRITTVVGANESGKSHLLTAIEKGIRGEGITRRDFCRYSQLFSVQKDQRRLPDFGFEWAGVSPEEQALIRPAVGTKQKLTFDSFLLFRTDGSTVIVYFPGPQGYSKHQVRQPDSLIATLPKVFRLQENVGLPSSAPILFLANDSREPTDLDMLPRHRRDGLFKALRNKAALFATKESVASASDEISHLVGGSLAPDEDAEEAYTDKRKDELRLAHDLIRKVAGVDGKSLTDLHQALQAGDNALAQAIIERINSDLRSRLNFPQWWVQDRQFSLRVAPRIDDLVFTIRDRTETEYSFAERSSGLRYFLSYYIQYLAHDRASRRDQILLMDEPDAYLSNQGQQDLLKILDRFANPQDKQARPIQVIYVTHSPFLIDRNHGERIRVLEKGVGEEGTRVVRDASRNHYEPLRSAFGSFVGETAFIGNCNLVVEGQADQILLASSAMHLQSINVSELDTLDLNRITIVPASGASFVPYIVYLARGRDIEQPAVIALLDSDDAGNDAKKQLLRGRPKGKQLLKPEYILQVGELSVKQSIGGTTRAPIATEDLVPLTICAEATRRYLREVCEEDESVVTQLTIESIGKFAGDGKSVLDCISENLQALKEGLHIEKNGFARAVMETLADLTRDPGAIENGGAAVKEMENNVKVLFRQLRMMQRAAEHELTTERISARINRARASFLQDNDEGARREHGALLFADIERSLDGSEEADRVRQELLRIRREFKLDEDQLKPIENYAAFRENLNQLQYVARLATQRPTLQEAVASAPEKLNPEQPVSSLASPPLGIPLSSAVS